MRHGALACPPHVLAALVAVMTIAPALAQRIVKCHHPETNGVGWRAMHELVREAARLVETTAAIPDTGAGPGGLQPAGPWGGGPEPKIAARWLCTAEELQAMAMFGRAQELHPAGHSVVLALAVSTPSLRVARAALASLHRRPTDCRDLHLLLPLVAHPDLVLATQTAQLLRDVTQRPLAPSAKLLLVETALTHWPADDLDLEADPANRPPVFVCTGIPVPTTPRQVCIDGWERSRIVAHVIETAMATGDRRLIDRLVANAGKVNPDDPRVATHAIFVLECLGRAAPHVDAATALQLFTWYRPHVDRWGDPSEFLMRERWRAGVLHVLCGIYPHVPDEALPWYREQFRHSLYAGYFRERLLDLPADRRALLHAR